MSLRARLGLVLTLVFALVLGVGAAIVIHNARTAVSQEVGSTADLALQLLEIALIGEQGGAEAGASGERLLRQIAHLERARHLRVDLPGAAEPAQGEPGEGGHGGLAPPWFVKLVEPKALESRRALAVPGLPSGELVVRADPRDEIDEAWEEAWPLLALLAACLALCILAVFLAVDRALRPIEAIERALAAVEAGDYAARVPRIALPELDRIGRKVDHMARVLEQSREENRALVKRSLAIQEQERRYLARELHDEMGQCISAIKAVAVSVAQGLGEGQEQAGAGVRTIEQISSRMYEGVRGMMRRLRPEALDELGLLPALENMVDEWNARHEELFCSLSARALPAALPEEVEIGLYRIVQECLTNVARHARASRVEVVLGAEGGTPPAAVVLEVRDDGVGFPEPAPARGFGLRGIRERVESLQGRLEVGNAGGAHLRVSLPLQVPA